MRMLKIDIPTNARSIIELLEEAGYEAYVVGGCVRDALLDREPADWDITTSAEPERIKEIMAAAGLRTIDTGIAHGTVTVFADHEPYEVTTYRADGTYTDGRHPDSIEFLKSINGDLARRDFTINAMAYNPERGIIDLFSGQEDLRAGILRAVGDPRERFAEDALRIVRGLRFAARFGFEIEPGTSAAIHELRGLLDNVSAERIWVELSGLLMGEYAVPVIREYSDVIFAMIPELEPLYGFDQHNPFHIYDVWEHTLHALEAAPPEMTAPERLAVLLHDVGKPYCLTFDEDGKGHMYGHEKLGEPIARDVCRRLKLSRVDRDTVLHLVRDHMFSIPDTGKAMRRFLLKHGPERARQLFAIRRCDKAGIGRGEMPDAPMSIAFAKAELLMEEQLNAEPVFSVKDLAINGNDLIELGVPQGPQVGEILRTLLQAVVDGDIENDPEKLIGLALESFNRKQA